MIVCPECQFENPEANKFCQRCGSSLVTQTCPICDSEVSWTAKDCPECGAMVAQEWLAIAYPLQPESEQTPFSPLDLSERYQALVPPETPTSEIRVWDSQPLQKTYLETLIEQQDGSETAAATGPIADDPNIEFWRQVGVCDPAIPYLVLQESLSPAIPVLQDTWQKEGHGMIVVEHRADWDLLIEAWGSEAIPFSQLLYWLDETLRLWSELAKFHCCQSLLTDENLRLDEDQLLCFALLLPDPADQAAPPLSELGQLWKRLFAESGRTLYGPMLTLLERLGEGEIETVDQARTELQAIARQQEIEEATPTADNDPTPEPVSTEEDPDKMVYRGMGDDMPTVVLPMQLLSLSDAGFTDIGQQRDHNEDHFGIETSTVRRENVMSKHVQSNGLYIVCDGMGGHAAGEVASAMAVETLQQYFQTHWSDRSQLPDEDTIREGILITNEKLYSVNMKNARSGSGRMGTTLVMVLVSDINIAIAHVGDSRVYRITRKHGVEQLTVDHEVGQREILRGVDPQDAYARPDAYQLTQALGPRDNDYVHPDVQFIELNEDTLLLLCSDGISDNDLIEQHYATYLTPLIASKANLDSGIIDLVDFANEFNGHDNITGVVIRIKMRPNADQF
ncbi:serine/threonine phosphatase [Spirulina major CS-329]|nr:MULTISPECIES: serine/threonine phosphatase [Spirulina]MDB9494136.1 serine/threonine phosphatase [Spirulina subsalsa CS-330]MDB9504807.1 serine/threonine phosphatase [Spirulina major CS-329]